MGLSAESKTSSIQAWGVKNHRIMEIKSLNFIKITEYPQLEGTHKDYQGQCLASRRSTQNFRPGPQKFLGPVYPNFQALVSFSSSWALAPQIFSLQTRGTSLDSFLFSFLLFFFLAFSPFLSFLPGPFFFHLNSSRTIKIEVKTQHLFRKNGN